MRLLPTSTRSRLIAAAASTVVISAMVTGYQFHKYRKFRANPDWHTFEQEITNSNLMSPIARRLIFKPGSDIYNEELLNWLKNLELDGAIMDQSNMDKFLSPLNQGQIISLTKSFGAEPNALLPHIKSKLFSTAKGCYFSSLNDDSIWSLIEEIEGYNDESFEDSTEESGDAGDGKEDFETHVDPLTLTTLEGGDNFDVGTIPWGISINMIEDKNLRTRIKDCIVELSPEASKYFPMQLMPTQGKETDDILSKLKERENAILIAKISLSSSDSAKRARTWLIENVPRIPDTQIAYIHKAEISSDVRTALFDRWMKEENYERAIASIRQTLLAGDDTAADRMARPILDGPDSSLKKNLIVILARNHTNLGRSRIDFAFTGKWPRNELFYSFDNYFRSKAMEQYSQLAGHGYLEVGKQFPTIYCVRPDSDEEQGLRNFVNTYPWFPATDDAQLRLVSRLLLDKNFDSAELELDRLEATEYVDSDAKELIPNARDLIRKARAGTYTPPTPEELYAHTVSEKCWNGRRKIP